MAPPRTQRFSMPAPEDYFRGVSPLCKRILEDMARVREKYGENWEDLSYQEQCKILDQTIVDEATVRRYENGNIPGPDCEYFPKLKLSTGQKIVSDEKLSARGYSCSWRDEHSAPFSWHTRSQMDLTLDTPPPTPTQSLSSHKVQESVLNDNEVKDKFSKKKALASLPLTGKTFKATPFLWHYEPQHDLKPPEPPDLVIGSSLSKEGSKGTTPLLMRGASFNHMVVRAEEERHPGFLNWFRGAIGAITGICVPLHSCSGERKGGTLLHPSSPFIHPELRPPHVIAKAAKLSLPTTNQPKTPSSNKSDSYYRLPKDSTQTSECASIETSLTYDINSDKGSHTSEDIMKGISNINQNSRMPLCNRNSYIYGTFAEEEDFETNITTEEELDLNMGSSFCLESNNKLDQRHTYDEVDNQGTKGHNYSPFDIDEELPLISLSTNNDNIPKTGFDFLDNW